MASLLPALGAAGKNAALASLIEERLGSRALNEAIADRALGSDRSYFDGVFDRGRGLQVTNVAATRRGVRVHYDEFSYFRGTGNVSVDRKTPKGSDVVHLSTSDATKLLDTLSG